MLIYMVCNEEKFLSNYVTRIRDENKAMYKLCTQCKINFLHKTLFADYYPEIKPFV